MRNEKGITLITMVITIIIMTILAVVIVSTVITDRDTIMRAREADVTAEFATYKDEFDAFVNRKYVENIEFDIDTLFANTSTITYNTKVSGSTDTTIVSIMPTLRYSDYLNDFVVQSGKLTITTSSNTVKKAAEALDITVIAVSD